MKKFFLFLLASSFLQTASAQKNISTSYRNNQFELSINNGNDKQKFRVRGDVTVAAGEGNERVMDI